MVASLRGGVESSRRRTDSPQDDEPDSAACCGEPAQRWRSLGTERDRPNVRGDRHVTFGRTTWLGVGCPEGKQMERRDLSRWRGAAGVRARIVLQWR